MIGLGLFFNFVTSDFERAYNVDKVGVSLRSSMAILLVPRVFNVICFFYFSVTNKIIGDPSTRKFIQISLGLGVFTVIYCLIAGIIRLNAGDSDGNKPNLLCW